VIESISKKAACRHRQTLLILGQGPQQQNRPFNITELEANKALNQLIAGRGSQGWFEVIKLLLRRQQLVIGGQLCCFGERAGGIGGSLSKAMG
jgi:hypothetical protein